MSESYRNLRQGRLGGDPLRQSMPRLQSTEQVTAKPSVLGRVIFGGPKAPNRLSHAVRSRRRGSPAILESKFIPLPRKAAAHDRVAAERRVMRRRRSG